MASFQTTKGNNGLFGKVSVGIESSNSGRRKTFENVPRNRRFISRRISPRWCHTEYYANRQGQFVYNTYDMSAMILS